MVHDFTLIYTLNPEADSQDGVLRRLAASDCADATVGWGRPGHVALAFNREALDRDAAVAQAVAQMAQICRVRRWSGPGAGLVSPDLDACLRFSIQASTSSRPRHFVWKAGYPCGCAARGAWRVVAAARPRRWRWRGRGPRRKAAVE